VLQGRRDVIDKRKGKTERK